MSAVDIQALLRFLTKDAKVPLAIAMSKVKEMQSSQLGSIEDISKSKIDAIKLLFPDEKVAKQILNAAKRMNKKRMSDAPDTLAMPAKRKRLDPFETPGLKPGHEVEASLVLPFSEVTSDELVMTVLITNRAPLVLAFAVTLLKYTMPEQPLSSRLSLAQAVVSMNSQSKAKSIGISSGNTAEEEGWGQGQPTIKVMNREVRVLRRWGYDWKSGVNVDGATREGAGQATKKEQDVEEKASIDAAGEDSTALWGIDLDQLKKLNGPLTFTATSTDTAGLPVYSPHAARSYLLRSFERVSPEEASESPKKPKKKTAALTAADREDNLGRLLKTLDLLFESWATNLSISELDKRAWSFYVRVRPEVEHGVAGWGAKGQLKLADILSLRKAA